MGIGENVGENTGSETGSSGAAGQPPSGGDWYTGTWAHGNVVTLNGSGFGIKSPVAPEIWDPDGTYNYGQNNSYSRDTNPANQRHGFAPGCWYHAGTSNSIMEETLGNADRTGPIAPCYMSWWYRPMGSHCCKVHRVTSPQGFFNSADTSSWHASTPEVCPGHSVRNDLILSQNADGCTTFNRYQTGCQSTVGQWQLMESLMDSYRKMWRAAIDNVGNPFSNFDWDNACSNMRGYDMRIALFGINPGGDCNGAVTNWLADVYMDLTWKRVMVGNSGIRANVTQWEHQIPQNTWNNTTIELSVNQGAFPSFNGLWVYVFDDDDNVVADWPKQL